jgi:hypothetical protein
MYNENYEVTHCAYFEEGKNPQNSTSKTPNGHVKPKYDPVNKMIYEAATPSEIATFGNDKIALYELYPELSGQNHKFIMFDKLPGIRRRESLSNRGLKGKYEYEKDGKLIWSIETKHWFESDTDFPEGIKKTCKLYTMGGQIADSWVSSFALTADGKQSILKQQREMILNYFKGQQPELFNLLYNFFSNEINNYVSVGDKSAFQTVLENSKSNHPQSIVRHTLSQVVGTQSGGTITVLDGILTGLI